MENRSLKETLEETRLWTLHLQVQAYAPDGTEIYVDENIKDLLETIWHLGYETIYSCSGGEKTNSHAPDKILDWHGYIYFQTTVMAKNFMEALDKGMPADKHRYFLEVDGGLKDQAVRFDPEMVPLFEKVFKDVLETVPV